MTMQAEQRYFEQFYEDEDAMPVLGERFAVHVMKDERVWAAVQAGKVRVVSRMTGWEIKRIRRHSYYPGELELVYTGHSLSEVSERYPVIVESLPVGVRVG